MVSIKRPKIKALTYIYLMKHYAIIVAGGSGSRMKSSIPKQYLELNGLPILMHTVNAFFATDSNIQIILVLPPADAAFWKELSDKHHFTRPLLIAAGGKSRYESVRNGLAEIKEEDAIVAIHDGVRPLVSPEIIQNSFNTAEEYGNAVAVVQLKDSIRIVEGEESKYMDRTLFRLVQTPQTFRYKQLKDAYDQQYNPELFTDDASVVEANGGSIKLIEGSYKNIKITTTEDLKIAALFLQMQH